MAFYKRKFYKLEVVKSRYDYKCDASGKHIKKGEHYLVVNVDTGIQRRSPSGHYYTDRERLRVELSLLAKYSLEEILDMLQPFKDNEHVIEELKALVKELKGNQMPKHFLLDDNNGSHELEIGDIDGDVLRLNWAKKSKFKNYVLVKMNDEVKIYDLRNELVIINDFVVDTSDDMFDLIEEGDLIIYESGLICLVKNGRIYSGYRVEKIFKLQPNGHYISYEVEK